MLITRLRVSGFKSFGDPVEIRIEPGLTGLVGPNGCGKSNVVEALRWVMGESSARGLRGEDMDDVIFAGTAGRAGRDLAEVCLRLAGVGGSADEVEVVRSLVRGGGSSFRLNGREARARDIQRLFQDAAAGARSAAIVAQGQIAALIEARPDERRRMLEEAAGIGGLHSRRREAELKLEAAEANLARVGEAIRAQEERLQTLRQQARQAERYRKLVDELREAEALLLLARWRALDRAVSAAETAAVEAGQRSREALGEVERARAARAAAADGLERLHAAERDATERRVAAAAELERLRDAAARAERDRVRQAEILAEIDADLTADRSRAVQLDARIEAAAAELAALEASLPELAQRERDLAADCLATDARRAAAERADRDARASRARAEERRAARAAALAAEEIRAAELAAERQRHAAALPSAPPEPPIEEGPDRAALEAEAARAETAVERLRERIEAGRPAVDAAIDAEAAAAEALRACEADRQRRHGERERAKLALANLEARERDALATLERHRSEASDLEAERAGIDLADLESRARAAAAQRARLERLVADCVDRDRRSRAAADAAASALAAARAAEQRVEAELAAIDSLFPGGGASGLDLAVPEDLAPAVAAALGEDLEASLDPGSAVHWRLLPQPPGLAEARAAWGEPDIPALADLVPLPEALRASLALVRVVDASRAVALQASLRPGERLVSRDGGCWRWDGLVRLPGGADAATRRLLLAERRRALAGDLRAARAATAATAERAEEARRGAESAAADLARVQRELAEQVQAETVALVAADGARRMAARLDAERERIAADVARVERVAAEARHDAEPYRAALAVPEGPAIADEDRLRRAYREAADAAERARADWQTQCSDLQAAQRRAAEARAAADAARRRDDDRAATVAAARHAHEVARSRHEAAAARIAAEAEAATARVAAARTALAEADAALADAVLAADAAAAELAAVLPLDEAGRGCLAEARAALSAARDAALALSREIERGRAERDELARRIARLEQRRCASLASAAPEEIGSAVQDRLAGAAAALQAAEANCAELAAGRAAAGETLAAAEAALATASAALAEMREADALARQEHARLAAELAAAGGAVRDALGREPAEAAALPAIAGLLEAADPATLAERCARLRAARERIGPVNLLAEREFAEVGAEVERLGAERAELTAAAARLRDAIAELNREARERLLATYDAVARRFEVLHARLFGGGRARLVLERGGDPLAAGVEIEACPPGKRLQHVSLLSGGEKALTALALIFAFFLARPSPLCVLDEVDAPLDDANVARLLDLMRETAGATGTRFVVVTHHPLTMSRMDRLYGVTMIERGVSRLVSVELARALAMRATA